MPRFEGELRSLSNARYAILVSRWNPRITDALESGARRALLDHGVAADAIDLYRVPGAWELPQMAALLAKQGKHVALIALGCVVRGQTRHFEHIADECARGLMRVALDFGVPVINGVLAVDDHAHAEARAGGVHGNKGEEAALVALEMAHLASQLEQASP